MGSFETTDIEQARMDFRTALGKFPTGVTIITCKSQQAEYIGMTASSFNSVSLDPPLVLWSIDKRARSLDAFSSSEGFVVHVLAEGQEDMSNLFARQGADKFADLEVEEGFGGAPMLADYCARFQCQLQNMIDAGDHLIVLGKVVAYDCNEQDPLLFHSSRYARMARD